MLSAQGTYQDDGDIFDRFYVTEKLVYADQVSFPSAMETNSVNIDMQKVKRSIRAIPSRGDYRWLLYTNLDSYTDNPYIPSSMRSKIDDLVFQTLMLDEDHFNTVLLHFKNFLTFIDTELKSTPSLADVKKLCNFKYDFSAKFGQHATTKDSWNQPLGLFGNRTGELNEAYTKCVATWNQHLFNEFYNDYSTLID